ncbi:Urease accessory protein UreE [Roseovarius sp. EC-HK134]|uniref:urease accessory protein UreE n=1 Tax=unclassified Roseovarius TaxID=2614913 RepID=UPI00125C920E|nr:MULTISPECIES: urease accessory protein UreE [unclassified Roseovarius]VVT03756.1 Urease accessory protein UreE [Roseovarius sp. EC-HK134]VVT04156.1 Urease accessory protein UreE [Roseovarius sp. EC-SD190]
MTDLPVARHLLHHAPDRVSDTVVLDYDARLMRRKRLVGRDGLEFLVDLAEVTNLDDHWGFALDDGRAVAVEAAPEDLIEVRGDLARLAWHIGNRHTPCQIGADHLCIRRDHVIEAMLAYLGAKLTPVTGPFRPEGGAYGKGRTMGHDHGDHSHAHHSHA